MAEHINIGGRLHSVATEHIVAGANEIQDDTLNKTQAQINEEINNTLEIHDSAIEGLNSQNYKSYTATNETTTVTDVLPALGTVDTIYRLGNWDGEQYDTTRYAEYAWVNTGIDQGEYILLDIKNYGIDDEPTTGSNNLPTTGNMVQSLAELTFSPSILLEPTSSANGWKLNSNGTCVQDSDYKLVKYSNIQVGDVLKVNLEKESDGVFQFQNNSTIPSNLPNNYLIGDTNIYGGIGMVKVPTGATFLIVSQLISNTSNSVEKLVQVDETPTANSKNLVESGGVAAYVEQQITQNTTFKSGEKIIKVGIEDNLNSINKSNVPNAVQCTVLNDKVTKITGGECTEVVEFDNLEIYSNSAYINPVDGRLTSASNVYTTKSIQLKVGDKIRAFTQGTGIGLIGFRTTDESSATPTLIEYTVLEVANNMTDYIEYTVETDGYYSFSGRQDSLSVIIGKNTNYEGELVELDEHIDEVEGRVDTVEETVDELINGEVISTQITLDDIDDNGAILNYYLNMSSLTCTGGSNLIITKPIYLNVGDSVTCQTGGTGVVLFGKSPSENIDRFTTGFTSIKNANSSSVTTYSTTINEAGWYVFSGRINRNDGTNLVVNVIKYSQGKGIQEQLDEKADKNDLTDINIPAIGLSVGADKVKDAIPASPWFDADSQSSGFDYGTYLDDKLDSVPYGQRFIFITDYHYGANTKKSAALIDYCRNRLGIKTIIHGGDVHNEYETAERAVQDWLNFNRDFVFRIGNDFKQILGDHDRNGGTGHTPISYEVLQKLITGYDSHELTFDNLYDEQVSELGWSSSDMSQYEAFKRMHYFFDDVTIKTRFICLVTRIIPQGQGLVYEKLGNYDSGVLLLQMDFLYSALMSTPKGYNIVVIGHNVVGDKSYSISVGESTVSRYNVNEPVFKGYWSNVIKQIRGFMTKTAFSANIQYLDWESEDIETKNYDFSNAPDAGIVFCMGGDLHWDILAKSQLVDNTETLSTVEVISLPSGTEPTVATQGTINKNTDILNVVTMTDGGDRGYRGIVEAPAQDYDDDTDSFRICKPNTAGTIDSQAFDIVTINDKYISFTRIGSGNDRIVYLE